MPFFKNVNFFHITNQTYNLRICDFPLMYVVYTQLSITEIFTSFPWQAEGPSSLHNNFFFVHVIFEDSGT